MNHPYPVHNPGPARSQNRRRMPRWVLGLIITGGLCVFLVLLLVAWLLFQIEQSPDTFVYSGNQIPARFVDTAREQGVVSDNENVLFFYSDAFLDVEKAMYILTDQHLVLCNQEWTAPKKVIAFNEIVDVAATWSSQWIVDSMVSVELNDGSVWTFPLSMENGTDRRFVDKLCELTGLPPLP